MNTPNESYMTRLHDHVCFPRPIEDLLPSTTTTIPTATTQSTNKKDLPTSFSDTIMLGPDNQLSDLLRIQFRQVLRKFDSVFNSNIPGYNSAAGNIDATVNMGPVQPPQRKGHVPQYSRNQLVELQDKYRRAGTSPSLPTIRKYRLDARISIASSPSRQPSPRHHLVTAFTDVGRYSIPQPSLISDVDSTLRTIAPWTYIWSKQILPVPFSKSHYPSHPWNIVAYPHHFGAYASTHGPRWECPDPKQPLEKWCVVQWVILSKRAA